MPNMEPIRKGSQPQTKEDAKKDDKPIIHARGLPRGPTWTAKRLRAPRPSSFVATLPLPCPVSFLPEDGQKDEAISPTTGLLFQRSAQDPSKADWDAESWEDRSRADLVFERWRDAPSSFDHLGSIVTNLTSLQS